MSGPPPFPADYYFTEVFFSCQSNNSATKKNLDSSAPCAKKTISSAYACVHRVNDVMSNFTESEIYLPKIYFFRNSVPATGCFPTDTRFDGAHRRKRRTSGHLVTKSFEPIGMLSASDAASAASLKLRSANKINPIHPARSCAQFLPIDSTAKALSALNLQWRP